MRKLVEYPTPSLNERDRRWAAVRKEMDARELTDRLPPDFGRSESSGTERTCRGAAREARYVSGDGVVKARARRPRRTTHGEARRCYRRDPREFLAKSFFWKILVTRVKRKFHAHGVGTNHLVSLPGIARP